MSYDQNVFSGYGFALDQVKTDKFTKQENHLYDTLLDPDAEYFEDIALDYNFKHQDDPVYATGYVDGQDQGGDTFFIYIPARSVVSDEPIKTYTVSKANKLIIKHTKHIFKAVYDYAKDDKEEFPKDLQKLSDKEIHKLIDSIVDKMNIDTLVGDQEYVLYS